MKKILITFIGLAVFVPSVMAATIASEYSVTLSQNESREVAPFIITSTSNGDIKAEHGIRIMLEPDEEILWDERPTAISGTALDRGKVDLNVQLEYSSDYKSVFIPVKEDLEATDWIRVSGLGLRAYDDVFGVRYFGMDLDGDSQPDVNDINSYKVQDFVKNDLTPPYQITDLNYEHQDGNVAFSWVNPPDYDFEQVVVNRTRVKDGFELLSSIYSNYSPGFTDSDLVDVTFASYSFVTSDLDGNWSEPIVVEIDFTEPSEEPVVIPEEEPEETVVEPTGPAPGFSEEEVEEQSRLLNYYNVRYSIKCKPSGVPVPENNSACLWARIDLVFAQEVTGEVIQEEAALTDHDLELMALRRKWPEMRHQDNCIDAPLPASYCSALGKALDRISYFLD